jgi:steroid delta-isomerase-like uncharacterized protein
MSSQNKVLIEWIVDELFNQKRTEVAEFLYSRHCTGNSPHGRYANREEFLAGLRTYAAAFPGFRIEIESLIANERCVVAHYTFVGTHKWAGVPSQGQTLKIPGVLTTYIEDGRVVRQDFVWDTLGAYRQFWSRTPPQHSRAA